MTDAETGRCKKVTIRCATLFKNAIEHMKDNQWNDIIQTALATNPKERIQVKKEEQDELAGDGDAQSDNDELVDPRYNPATKSSSRTGSPTSSGNRSPQRSSSCSITHSPSPSASCHCSASSLPLTSDFETL